MAPPKRNLDRLAWTERIAIRSFGATIAVRSNFHGALPDLLSSLPASVEVDPISRPDQVYSICVEPLVGSSSGYSLYRGNSLLASCGSAAEARAILQSSLHLGVAMHSPYLFVHAGVVGWEDRAIVIPGISFAGKSTLVAELVRLGATYYSDEYAVLDQQGWVHSYPKPLSLRQAAGGPRQVPLAELGGNCCKRPLRAGLVAAVEYREDAIWRPRALTAAESMMVLIENTVMARTRPERTMQTLRRTVLDSSGLLGKRAEARECADELLRFVTAASVEKCAEYRARNRAIAGL